MLQMAQRTQLDLLQLRFLRFGQALQKRSGPKVAEHGVPGLQIAQDIVGVQISMQQTTAVQMGDGGAYALQQLLGLVGLQAKFGVIDITCATVEAWRPG